MEFKSGIIDTFVGTGELGDRGNGGPHNLAELNEPFMCAFDSKGDLYFCESRGNRVRKVDMLNHFKENYKSIQTKKVSMLYSQDSNFCLTKYNTLSNITIYKIK